MYPEAKLTMVNREAVITAKGKIHFGAAIIGALDGSIEINNYYSQVLFEFYYTSNNDANKTIAAMTHKVLDVPLSDVVLAFSRGLPSQIITVGQLLGPK